MDLFYYGSQDVPPPSRGRTDPSRATGSGRPAVCESCSAPVSPGDLEAGRASEIYGLVLCETCRLKARAEERVELYFCDRCQVSVPVYRVDTGEALSGDGRILCLDCRRRAGRRLSRLFLGAMVLLVLGSALWWGVFRTRERVPESEGARHRALLERIEDILERLPTLEGAESDAAKIAAIRASADVTADRSQATKEALELVGSSLYRTRVEFLRRMEILERDARRLLTETEAALVEATAER